MMILTEPAALPHLHQHHPGNLCHSDRHRHFRPSSTAAAPRRTLTSLPYELRHMILSSAPDLRTLQSLCLTSRLYYATYISSAPAILSPVLTRELSTPSLQTAALALHFSRQNLTKSPESAQIFFKAYEVAVFRDRDSESRGDPTVPAIPAKHAVALARNHNHVCRLTEDFFRVQVETHPAAGIHGRRGWTLADRGVSRDEWNRVVGGLYMLWLVGTLLDKVGNGCGGEMSRKDRAIELARGIERCTDKWKVQEALVVWMYLRDRLQGVLETKGAHGVLGTEAGRVEYPPRILLNHLSVNLPLITHLLFSPHAPPTVPSLPDPLNAPAVIEVLDILTWGTDAHYDYPARRLCRSYVLCEPRWIYNEEVVLEACIWDDERLKGWGFGLPDQAPKPVYWIFNLDRGF